MRPIWILYNLMTLFFAISVSILNLMGVTDAPLGRVWLVWLIPCAVGWLIIGLSRASDWLDRRTHF